MMILKKMRKNPDAKTVDKTKQHMVTITEDPSQIHNATVTKYKSLDYEKYKPQDKNLEQFNATSVIKDADGENEFK